MTASEHAGVIVLTTAGEDEAAAALARALVEEGLAACVSRAAVRSVYRWQGEVCDEGEVMLVIKTSASRVEELEKRLLELHPYECPELVRIEPAHVGQKYLEWLLAAVR